MNRLAADVEIVGSLRFANSLLLEGKVEGEINGASSLVIGEDAFVKGTINAQNVSVHGHVEGDISATERCEIKSSASMTGNVTASKFSIEEGASFQGRSRVQKPA